MSTSSDNPLVLTGFAGLWTSSNPGTQGIGRLALRIRDGEHELQIRQNKGILAVTRFTTVPDSDVRNNYVCRELYHRVAA